MINFDGKVVIVTGGAKGIGAGICTAFAEAGASLLCADIDVAAGEKLIEELADQPGEVRFHKADVSVAAECQALVNAAVSAWGGLDVVCNNVGIQPTNSYLPAHEFPEEMWDRIMDVNVKSRFLMAKYAVPEMKKRGGGVIINTASVQGLQSAHDVPAYAASKGADLSLVRQLALDYAGWFILGGQLGLHFCKEKRCLYFLL
ncbi:SDR family NAD(P)-dependent oxidoreductase [Chloroflexi bacterium TSY]|nr:SDR family NAD(P)-dependent oxidoreductase [Chloroflexi bacterium TSY]